MKKLFCVMLLVFLMQGINLYSRTAYDTRTYVIKGKLKVINEIDYCDQMYHELKCKTIVIHTPKKDFSTEKVSVFDHYNLKGSVECILTTSGMITDDEGHILIHQGFDYIKPLKHYVDYKSFEEELLLIYPNE